MLLVFRLFPSYSDIGLKVKSLIYDELQISNIKYTRESGDDVSLSSIDANGADFTATSQIDVNDPNSAKENIGNTVLLTKYLDDIVKDRDLSRYIL